MNLLWYFFELFKQEYDVLMAYIKLLSEEKTVEHENHASFPPGYFLRN